MRVWRIHLKPDIEKGFDRFDLLEFCKKEKLIGVGWEKIQTRENSEDAIHKEAEYYSDVTSAIKALNAMRKMQIGDLIWTRLDSVYYLCRVTGLWENRNPNEQHKRFDISNYVNVEWLEIGYEQNVPGKVISSFRPAASAQSVRGVEDISMYLWNKYSKSVAYEIKNEYFDFWSVLSSEQIEELVLLYLQVVKGYYIYSSTVKHSFPTYECQLVNAKGRKCYPQVKSGGVSLDANHYMKVFQVDPDAEVYLFTTSESYTINDGANIKVLYKSELEEFIRQYKQLLPGLTASWIDLCGFISK